MTLSLQRRELFLDAMGLGPVWTRRANEPEADQATDAIAKNLSTTADDAQVSNMLAMPTQVPLEDGTTAEVAWSVESDSMYAGSTVDIATMDWTELNSAVKQCRACELCRTRKHTVFGVGSTKTDWLFVGEGPGYHEDREGQPFIGPSGGLLDNMLRAIGLDRQTNVYITNIVKCRPTDANGDDRAPTANEITACRPFLNRQITLLQPAMIVALGKTAATSLITQSDTTQMESMPQSVPVSVLRGKVHQYRIADEVSVPMVVTYHPAYLLRRLVEKGKAWADLCLAMSVLAKRSDE
ncbi:MAG: uracil-DNA glycosylase [Pseudomonadota bacterium]